MWDCVGWCGIVWDSVELCGIVWDSVCVLGDVFLAAMDEFRPTNCGDGGDNFAQLELVQDGRLAGGVQAHCPGRKTNRWR